MAVFRRCPASYRAFGAGKKLQLSAGANRVNAAFLAVNTYVAEATVNGSALRSIRALNRYGARDDGTQAKRHSAANRINTGQAVGRGLLSALSAGLLIVASAAYDIALAVPTARVAQHDFKIPTGPLAPALRRFAGETGLALVYDASVTEGAGTMGVDGRYAPMLALEILLACTGVSYHFIDAQTVVLQRFVTMEPVVFRDLGLTR